VFLPGTSGTARYHTAANGWTTAPLRDGALPAELLHIQTELGCLILNPAHLYKRFGDSLEAQPLTERPVTVKREENGYRFTLTFPSFPEGEGHSWALLSESPLIEWTPAAEALWAPYGRLSDQRWCYDGYYYRTPESYTPFSAGMYWRNPGAYLPRALTLTGGSRASERLSWVMLDTMLSYQHKDGYWPSSPESRWLKEDYGIGGGFYDTRFNADTTETYLVGYQNTGDKRFLTAALKQLDWFTAYAAHSHYTVTDGSREGWLVYDYTWPGHEGEVRPALCALNHQLQEIQTLLRAYEFTGNEDHLSLSETLTEGVRLTRDRWLKPDGSLHYAYLPDGTMGMADYDALTYNNLFDLQALRERLKLGRDPDLQVLMDSKKQQMDAAGITGYRT
jgi:hypothetical protein